MGMWKHLEDERDEDGNPRRRCLHISVCGDIGGRRLAKSCDNTAAGVASSRDDPRSQLWVCDAHKGHYRHFIPKRVFWDQLHHNITVEALERE